MKRDRHGRARHMDLGLLGLASESWNHKARGIPKIPSRIFDHQRIESKATRQFHWWVTFEWVASSFDTATYYATPGCPQFRRDTGNKVPWRKTISDSFWSKPFRPTYSILRFLSLRRIRAFVGASEWFCPIINRSVSLKWAVRASTQEAASCLNICLAE